MSDVSRTPATTALTSPGCARPGARDSPGDPFRGGLEAALESLVGRSTLPVRLEVDLPQEPPAPVAAAAYFAVSEALTTVAKHVHASDAVVSVEATPSGLRVVVVDDGVGGAVAAEGSGLAGMADRAAAAGGTLRVVSPPGGGTRLDVELPCEWS